VAFLHHRLATAEADLKFIAKLLDGRLASIYQGPTSAEQMRASSEAMLAQPMVRQPVATVPVASAIVGGVAGEWLGGPASPGDAVALFLHGGGYVRGSLGLGRIVASGVAALAGAPVFSAGYRQAPEARFPAAFDDAAAAYEGLLAQGFDPRRILVAGESAGGAMALSLAMQLRDRGRPLPAAVTALSPVVDMTMRGDSWRRNAGKDLVTAAMGLQMLELYIDRADRRDPRASPAFGRLDGLPPLSLHLGEHELMYDDALAFAGAASEAGTSVAFWTYEGLPHGFTKFAIEASAVSIGLVAQQLRALRFRDPGH
jgi:epsilon-lactone hydrolase